MSVYGISGLTLNHAGEVVEASIAPIDPETRQSGVFATKSGKDIASMIISGDDVRGYFGLMATMCWRRSSLPLCMVAVY